MLTKAASSARVHLSREINSGREMETKVDLKKATKTAHSGHKCIGWITHFRNDFRFVE